ncbi:MAG: MaoC/PaaZ C-terminal domain-containing protein [Alphaproteobacteria bacterium]|jgi:acyl dehydratase|nr:MaoC/PaaZ C-terminal domain-containing protein [Alphaproteobacteria bacterium]MDP6564377.1 MaoC/PaaZ C-terminal domain-containing protein [Alphaproteobacteria bacterium]MDP6812547.1 MaoC/PaaZ C-terminal domain-containing protein [Alphaproteobacteria bacterium]
MNLTAPFTGKVHFEDFAIGDRFAYGAYEMRREEMIAFAEQFDPEPFHLEAGAAQALGWSDVIASGPHVGAVWRRISKDAFAATAAFVSPGWRELRWLQPVFPGYVLSARSEVVAARPLKSRPDLGFVQLANEIHNQRGEVTTTLVADWFLYRRTAE